ncbi:B3 domain-containing transcription factor VRN1-like [Euphorbia lathyris]|uniref:B3 domain-containing transcription factor VRN1-like n=1 Tax=Euphorbia lathyris TaxID=212925 RepID=UPI00331390C1
MKLQVADGREWEIHLYKRGFNFCDIGQGWSAFSMDNNLEKGDVCVLELLKNRGVVKVSIFRASEDETPAISQFMLQELPFHCGILQHH